MLPAEPLWGACPDGVFPGTGTPGTSIAAGRAMAQWASGSKQHLGLGLLRTWVGLGTSSNPLSPTLPEIGQGPLTHCCPFLRPQQSPGRARRPRAPGTSGGEAPLARLAGAVRKTDTRKSRRGGDHPQPKGEERTSLTPAEQDVRTEQVGFWAVPL